MEMKCLLFNLLLIGGVCYNKKGVAKPLLKSLTALRLNYLFTLRPLPFCNAEVPSTQIPSPFFLPNPVPS